MTRTNVDLTDQTPAVVLKNVYKSFGSVHANSDVSLEIARGTIHGIIGENGAGKSTAMKILYGMFAPDAGEIVINGQRHVWSSSKDAIQAGLGMVHQHFMLSPVHDAVDNIILGNEPTLPGTKFIPRFLQPIARLRARRDLQRLSDRYGLKIEFDATVETLPVGVQQRIEILKVLYRKAEILILDEPTAVLTPQETAVLFENLRKLKLEGKTIIIVTHKLREVIDFTENVTVFRQGRVIATVRTSETSDKKLAELMIGRPIHLDSSPPPCPKIERNAVLEISDLSLIAKHQKPFLSHVSLTIKSGEVLGVAGVEGNGQSRLLQVLLHPRTFFGAGPVTATGTIKLFGQEISELGALAIKNHGVSFIPEDRIKDGLLLSGNLVENFALGLHRRREFSHMGLVSWKKLSRVTEKAIEQFDVRPAALSACARELSGGNQQKLIIAREFYQNPRLLIAAQPTRGVDIGAIEFIRRKILEARDRGAAVLLISSELDEILALSDRVAVFFEGRVACELPRSQCNETELGFYMGGAHAKN